MAINGAPGTVWTNDTGKIRYQFHCNWHNTCGVCAQFDGMIGNSFAIPYHYSCRCFQSIVLPGKDAQPFTDFRVKVGTLDPVQQSALVGKSNYKLIQKGVVSWDDVVTEGRVRDLREVVSRNKLTVKQMVKAGVDPRIAEKAFESVNTAAHILADEARKRIADALKAKGLSNAEIKRAIGERLAGRLSIGGGPSGPQALPVKVTPSGPLTPAQIGKALGITIKPAVPGKVQPIPAKTPLPPPSTADFRDFKGDAKAIDNWVYENFKAWSDSLDPETRRSIEDYGGAGYKDLNYRLRAVSKGEKVIARPSADAAIERIKSSAIPLSSDVVLWRGADAKAFGDFKKVKGSVISAPAFTSTSLDQKVSEREQFMKGVLFKIKAPAGTPVVSVQAAASEGEGEREIVLMPDAKFRVLSVKQLYHDTQLVEIEVVP